MKSRLLASLAAALAGIVAAGIVFAAAADRGPASALRAKYDALRNGGGKSQFGIPLFIESQQTPGTLSGDIHAQVDHGFAAVRDALRDPRSWCEILILHPNVKGCSVAGREQPGGPAVLTVLLGSTEQPVKFTFKVAASTDDYLDIRLGADSGPVGTTDYRFRVQAMPLEGQRSLLHLAYSHGYGTSAKLAMQAYFSTLGRGKVGFTVVDRTPDGKPVYVGDLRGGLERNAMRYYFAIECHLDTLSAPAEQRLERSVRRWLAQTERYPLQLKEESDYLERKRGEVRRFEQQATALPAGRAGG
jgi:hypothetical protein